MRVNRFTRWQFWPGLLAAVNLIAGTLMLSLFTTGAVFGSLIPPLIFIFMGLSVSYLAILFAFTSPPASILKSIVLSFGLAVGMPFFAMLSASMYVASEEVNQMLTAVIRSLAVMAPMLTISAAPLAFPLLVVNFALLEGARLYFKRRSVKS